MEFQGMTQKEAIGFLARATLDYLSDGVNPAATPVLPNEIAQRKELIESLVSRARSEIGFDDASTLRDIVSDWLIEEADAILDDKSGERIDPTTVQRLSDEGALPGDAYNAALDRFFLTKEREFGLDDGLLALQAVKHPDMEQHFTSRNATVVGKASLFGKWFSKDNEPFFLIASAARLGEVLNIDHWWRLYPDDISFLHLTDLAEALERFSVVFGHEFSMGGWRGKFLKSTEILGQINHLEDVFVPGDREMLAVGTIIPFPHYTEIAFMVGVDIQKYRNSVQRHRRREMRRSH